MSAIGSMAERLRRLRLHTPSLLRWAVGLFIAAAVALFLWLGRDSDTGARPMMESSDVPSGDVLPPLEHEADAAAPQSISPASGDIIPPEEP
jgi:hypothetical protein